jgi:oligopeptide transport system substrate-binding protein
MAGRSRSARWAASAVALGLVLTACGSDDDDGDDETSGEAAGGGTVSVYNTEPENPLIPANTNETGGGIVVDNVFTPLVRLDAETAEPVNAVAASIESEDNQSWTITLNEGWTFHDGTDVTAQSFVDAWNWASYGPNGALNSYFFGPDGASIEGFEELQGEDTDGDGTVSEDEATVTEMSGLEVVDDLTFTVQLTRPFAIFPSVISYVAFAPLPEVFFDDPDAFGEAPVGNGPFELVTWDNNQQIILQKYEDYAGDNPAIVDEVELRLYSDNDAAYADLQANNLDVLDNLPVSALAGDTYQADLGDRWTEIPSGTITVITFPLYVEEYNNPDLSKAVSLAINRDEITEQIYSGTRLPADGWVSPIVDGYVEGQCGEFCTFDEELARQYLEDSGFDGRLTLSYNADGDHKAWTEAVCNQVSAVLDLECTATPEPDFATFREKINSDSMEGMFRSGWVFDYPNIENFLAPIYTTSGSANDGNYSNEEFDSLIRDAGSAESAEEANALYQEAERLLAEDMPTVPLWTDRKIGGWSENVANVTFSPRDWAELTTIEVN